MKKILLASLLIAIAAVGVSFGTQQQVTIVFSDWHLTEPHWEKALKEAMAIFEAQNPDIKVQLEYVSYGEKEVKYQTAIEAGVGPDVMHLHAYSLPMFMGRGYLYDITPFIQAEGPGFLDPWYPVTLQLMQKDGRYYAMPGDFMAMVLLYNKNLFAEAGLNPAQPPRTWDEFLDYAKKLTRDRDGDGRIDTWGFGTVGKIDPGFELRFTPLLLSNGADYLTPDNKCSTLNTPEAKAAYKFWIELYTVHGVIPPGVTDMTPGKVREQMAAEKVAMKLSSGWGPPIIYGINPALQAADALEMAPVPVKAGTDPQIRTTAWLSSWVINRNTKYPEQSWRLVKFITSKEMEQKWFDDARVLSSRRDVSEQYQPLLQDKFAKVIAAELSRAKFVPQLVEWPQIIEAVNVAVQEGYIGKDPMRALKDAHDKINNILAIYRKAYPAGSIVAAGDFDDGKPLDWLGVGYYQDVDKDGKVSPGDKRLKNVVEPCPAF